MTVFIVRNGNSIIADEVFLAWTSGSLSRMTRALEIRTNPIDRHFLLQSIVALAYKQRDKSSIRKLCRNVGLTHLAEFPTIAPHLEAEMGGMMPRITTFPLLATVLTEDGEFDEAIGVCELALNLGLKDGTTGGYAKRIERIQKAKEKRRAVHR